MKMSRMTAVAALLLLLSPAAAVASPPIHADVLMLVRDEKGKPLPGVNVTLDYADPTEKRKEKIKVEGNSGLTDERGIVKARAYIGWNNIGDIKLEMPGVIVTATKDGYQPFHEPNRFFYMLTAAKDRYTCYLHDVQLAPEGSTEKSRILPLSLRPTATVNPPFGDSATQFFLQAKLDVPDVLKATTDKPLFRIGVLQEKGDPKKPDVELQDDGKGPDKVRGDGLYTGALRTPSGESSQVVDRVELVIRPKDDFNKLIWDEGGIFRWIETKRTMAGLALYTRWVTVQANVVKVPVKWAMAQDIEKAQALYRESFGPEP